MEWRHCTYFRSLGTRTKFMATTRKAIIFCVLLLRKLLSTKESLE